MATHSSILAWRVSWTEEPDGLWFMGLQRVQDDWVTNTLTFTFIEKIQANRSKFLQNLVRTYTHLFLPINFTFLPKTIEYWWSMYALPDVQAGFRKGRGMRNQIANIHWITKNQDSSRKNIYFCFIHYAKALTVWITINCGNFEREGNARPPDLPLEKSVCRSVSNSRTGHGTTD